MAGGDVDGEGAARRRRQRRLRSWLKHERQSIAMALAEYTHHASKGQMRARAREEVEHATHTGLRAQKTPPPGERPGLPLEPGPQRSDRTVRRSSGDSLPTLALPVLAGSAGEAVDGAALRRLSDPSRWNEAVAATLPQTGGFVEHGGRQAACHGCHVNLSLRTSRRPNWSTGTELWRSLSDNH